MASDNRYSGQVRITENCVIYGVARAVGDVVEVTGARLWDDSPYRAVRLAGVVDGVPQYEPITVPVQVRNPPPPPLYTGTVRAHTPCHFGGWQRRQDDVFEVKDHQFFADDPFHPVKFLRFDEVPVGGPGQRLEKIARYTRLDYEVLPVNARMPLDHRSHPGVRRLDEP